MKKMSNEEFVEEVKRDLLASVQRPGVPYKYKPNPERIARLLGKPWPPRQAEVMPFPPKLSEQDLARRQAVIDQCWERNLSRWRELELEAGRTCHVGPGDGDYWRQ
jgi:hypothetical protein